MRFAALFLNGELKLSSMAWWVLASVVAALKLWLTSADIFDFRHEPHGSRQAPDAASLDGRPERSVLW